ncbi:peptidoglycan D,D-transpeptidase FtsI family protein [Protofrankia symbiont of Coriaria ruscifolia]|uniref:Peptidoglycan glycosyltransferase n=1 Tax=Candidatus Protofrankia californiensis TaxID=1839754 RepID=A0A1C3P7R4_9ACTN|nr:penicillin-binding protein 2 [Protofrankia symbiont of Coriaria ruscifolia]SBW25830.1 peptidoglycan glycosyltransferase [Candidatus Protofrankia californiensis]
MSSTLHRGSLRNRLRSRTVSGPARRGAADRWYEGDRGGFAPGYADPDGYRSTAAASASRTAHGEAYGDTDHGDGGPSWDEYVYDTDGYQPDHGRVDRQQRGRPSNPRRVRRPAPRGYQAGTSRTRAGRPGTTAVRPPSPRTAATRPPMRLGSPRRRLRVSVVVLCALLVVLAGRLTQLQAFQASTYAERAEQQRLRTVALLAPRGVITDRSGATLAQDVEARAVYADPHNVTDARAVANALAPLLDVPADTLIPKLAGGGRFAYLARGLDPAVGKTVTDLGLPGIGVLEERRRLYPSGALASNVVGFTTIGDSDVIVGGGGVESAYDRLLRGTDGLRRVEVDPAGRMIPSAASRESDPVPGSSVRLTLDRDIQWAAQQALAEAVRTTQADGGSVVVMVPGTGDILAMADAPGYDPNKVGTADPGTLKNRATQDVYEPGSVNKVITMAAAIDRGLISAETPVTVPPNMRIAGRTFTDAEPHGVEHLTAAGVLAVSSNLGTIQIARKLGSAGLESALRDFGLGTRTALRFPGESAGILRPASEWDSQQAATISYGQGMSATAIQMAAVYATIANGGVRVAPRLVDSTVSPDGTVHTTPRQPGIRVISEATAATVSRMLESVATDSGTAPLAAIDGYRVAGKTGTAQRVGPSGRYDGYVASFVGFAPADQPRAIVEVVLDNPRDGHYGGTVAAPVFQRVMTFALATLGVAPPGTSAPKLVLDLDADR